MLLKTMIGAAALLAAGLRPDHVSAPIRPRHRRRSTCPAPAARSERRILGARAGCHHGHACAGSGNRWPGSGDVQDADKRGKKDKKTAPLRRFRRRLDALPALGRTGSALPDRSAN